MSAKVYLVQTKPEDNEDTKEYGEEYVVEYDDVNYDTAEEKALKKLLMPLKADTIEIVEYDEADYTSAERKNLAENIEMVEYDEADYTPAERKKLAETIEKMWQN